MLKHLSQNKLFPRTQFVPCFILDVMIWCFLTQASLIYSDIFSLFSHIRTYDNEKGRLTWVPLMQESSFTYDWFLPISSSLTLLSVIMNLNHISKKCMDTILIWIIADHLHIWKYYNKYNDSYFFLLPLHFLTTCDLQVIVFFYYSMSRWMLSQKTITISRERSVMKYLFSSRKRSNGNIIVWDRSHDHQYLSFITSL